MRFRPANGFNLMFSAGGPGSGGLAGFEPGLQVGGEDGPGSGFGGFVPKAGFDEALARVAAALEDGSEAVRVGVFEAGGGGVGGVGGVASEMR